jgi:hypothetical protein
VIQNIHNEVDYQNILMGYVQKDDFWHIRREFEAAYKNLQFMVNPHVDEYFDNHNNIKWPVLSYPFEWRDKQSIINWLANDRVGSLILKQIWFCEQADSHKFIAEPCGYCVPCTAWKKLEFPTPTEPEKAGIEKQVTIDDVADLIDRMGDPVTKAGLHEKLQAYLDTIKPILKSVDISGMMKTDIEKLAEPIELDIRNLP